MLPPLQPAPLRDGDTHEVRRGTNLPQISFESDRGTTLESFSRRDEDIDRIAGNEGAGPGDLASAIGRIRRATHRRDYRRHRLSRSKRGRVLAQEN